MALFRKAIFDLLGEGQELSGAEKSLVNKEVDNFIETHTRATGEEPRPLFGTIYHFAHRVEKYGFRLPRDEQWEKEDMVAETEEEDQLSIPSFLRKQA